MKAITPIRWFIGLMTVALLLVCLPVSAQKKISKQRPVKKEVVTKTKPQVKKKQQTAVRPQRKEPVKPTKVEEPVQNVEPSKPEVQEPVKPRDIFAPTGTISGHGYVDLGLSVKWATCNVGASSPEGYGDFFAWGETSTKSSYDNDNSKTYKKKKMGIICGDRNYDAATANWGSPWRLPSFEEIKELLDGCTCTWTTHNGMPGVVFKSKKNGNAIFVPAAGSRDGTLLISAGSGGSIWSGSPDEYNANTAYYLDFGSSGADWNSWRGRRSGFSVRPVAE